MPLSKRSKSQARMRWAGPSTQPTRSPGAIVFENVPGHGSVHRP